MATVDPKLGLKGLNFYLVEKKTDKRDGFVSGQKLHKLGSRCSVTGEVVLDNVFVPDENFLGEEVGKGVEYAGDILNEVRVMTAMNALAISKGAMDDAKEYAKNRIAFGNPISKYQLIREKFAKYWAWYESSWNYAYKCAWMIQNKIPCSNECMMAKYHATEMCMYAVEEAMRIYGGNAFCSEYPPQRYWRDAKFLLYGGGTHEVLCDYLGRVFCKD